MQITKLERLLFNNRIAQKSLCDVIDNTFETGIPRTQLNRIVNGKSVNFKMQTIEKICVALTQIIEKRITPNDILDYENWY